MSKKCMKCGHIRQDSDNAPDNECPKCGAIYAKVEAAIAEAEEAAKLEAERAMALRIKLGRPIIEKPKPKGIEEGTQKQCPYCKELVLIEAIKCKHCGKNLPASPNAIANVLGIFMVIAVIYYFAGGSTDTKSSRSEIDLSPGGADAACYDAGMRLAGVYIANFSKMVDAKLMPTEVMEEGCNRQIGSDCIRQCKSGFQIEVKRLLKK